MLKVEISYRVMISWMILIYMWEIQFCKQLIRYVCQHSISRVNEFWPSLLLEVAFICNWSTYYWILVHDHIFVSTVRIRVVRIYFEYYQFWGTWWKFATTRVLSLKSVRSEMWKAQYKILGDMVRPQCVCTKLYSASFESITFTSFSNSFWHSKATDNVTISQA